MSAPFSATTVEVDAPDPVHTVTVRGQRLLADFWSAPLTLLDWRHPTSEFVMVEAVSVTKRDHYSTSLPAQVAATLKPQAISYTFAAPPEHLRMVLEARRRRLAQAADPLWVANNARMNLLLHQNEYLFDCQVNAQPVTAVINHDGSLASELVKFKAGAAPSIKGRKTIVVGGKLTTFDEFAKFYKHVLQPVNSHKPASLTIEITLRTTFAEYPSSDQEATLDDGLDGGDEDDGVIHFYAAQCPTRTATECITLQYLEWSKDR